VSFETFVRGHQLPPKMDASHQCGCGHVPIMNFPVLVFKSVIHNDQHVCSEGVCTQVCQLTPGASP
jgi:hypothetical protein